MADVNAAIDFVLRQEDSTMSGIVSNSPADRGGLTRFGVAAKWHPDLVRSGFYTCHRDEALAVAHQVYADEYAAFLQLPLVRSQPVATAMLSFAILENAAKAAQVMQQSLNQLGAKLIVDSSIGPVTLRALNAQNAVTLLPVFVERNRAFLQSIVTADPAQQKWQNGWMNRCNAVLKLIKGVTDAPAN